MEKLKVKKHKAAFLSPLQKQDIDRNNFFLLSPLRFYSAILKAVIVVPQGFVCDGTSDLMKDDSEAPGTVHDYCYRAPDHKIDIMLGSAGTVTFTPTSPLAKVFVAKWTADKIFLEAMKAWGVPAWKRWMKYLGVVLGGKSSYDTGHKRYKIVGWDGVDRRKLKRI